MKIARHSVRTAGLLLVLSHAALADTGTQDEEGPGPAPDRFELGVVEVTGSTDELALPYPGVDVVTDEDWRRHERYDATEAVNLLPGVMIENIGNRNERVVFIRGFDSRQIPLYIDGIPVYVPYSGSIDLGRFTTFDLAEIQVTKAFTSVLYGPNTLGGSINLISRRPAGKLEADILAGIGFDDELGKNVHRASANFGSNQGGWYIQGGASVLDRDDFTVSSDYTPGAAEDGGVRDNSDFKDTKLSLKLGLTPNETDEYALSYYKQDGVKGTPPYGGQDPSVRTRFWRWPFYDKESLYFLSRTAFGSGHYVRLRAYYDKFDNLLSSFDDNTYTTQNRRFAFNSTYDDHTWGGGTEFGFDLGPAHLLKVAASVKRDFHREQDDIGDPWEKFEDETLSIGIEDTWTISDETTLIAGASWNRQESRRADLKLPDNTIVPFPTGDDAAMNYQLGLFHDLSKTIAVHATAGRKTRFPTISNRYSGRFGSSLPNPDLAAETSDNYEIGFERNLERIQYGGAVFLSRLEDAIESVTIDDSLCASPPCEQAKNIAKQENKGIELYLDATLTSKLDLHLDYTWLDRKNKTRPEVVPTDTPQHKAFAYLVYTPVPLLDLIASIVYEGSRVSESTGERPVDSFKVANLKGSREFGNGWIAELGVNNVFDEDYAYDEGYPEPGRNFFFNLQYRFRN